MFQRIIIIVLFIAIAIWLFRVLVFGLLFKIGILLLLALGIIYLFKKIAS